MHESVWQQVMQVRMGAHAPGQVRIRSHAPGGAPMTDDLRTLFDGADAAETLERMMGGLLSAAHVTGWIKDRDRRYIYVTPAWESEAGFPAAAALGARDEDFRAPDVAARYREVDERILKGGAPETREDTTSGPDGTRWFMVTKFPVRDAAGGVIGIAGVATETTPFRSLQSTHRADDDLLSTVLESMPDLICRFTPDLVTTFANPAFTATYARLGETLQGRSLAGVLPTAVADDLAAAVARLSVQNEQATFDEVTHGQNGRARWREYRIRGVFSPDGTLQEVQAVGRDVTEERRYQTTLERMVLTANSRTAPLAETVTALLALGLEFFDMDLAGIGRFVDGSFQVEHLQRRDGSVGLPIGRIPAEERLALVAHDHNEPIAIEDLASRRLPQFLLDGTKHIKSFIGQRIEVAGSIYGTVMFCGTTARHRPFRPNELTLQRLLSQWMAFVFERHNQIAALGQRQAELQVILENVPAHIVTRGPDGAVLTANAAARDQSAPAVVTEADRAALQSGDPLLGRLERWEEADGQTRWMRTDRIPFKDPASAEPRLLVVATDVSELIEKEQALAQANEGLKQFAYIASHDLQEPLRKIGTFADILSQGLSDGNKDDVDYALTVIKEGARRSSQLIRDLLAWSRLTNQPIERQSIRLDALVRDTLADVLAGRPDAGLTVIDALDPVTVMADQTQARQLVENLIVNALKYRAPDRPARLVLRLAREGTHGAVVLEVEDNGIGFSQDYAALIFEPFRRLHSERQYTGTGVGLAICARVCERHGWTIACTGRPNEGATFRVEIPRRALVNS